MPLGNSGICELINLLLGKVGVFFSLEKLDFLLEKWMMNMLSLSGGWTSQGNSFFFLFLDFWWVAEFSFEFDEGLSNFLVLVQVFQRIIVFAVFSSYPFYCYCLIFIFFGFICWFFFFPAPFGRWEFLLKIEEKKIFFLFLFFLFP